MEDGPKPSKNERFPRPRVALEDVKTPEDFLNAVDFKTLNEIFTVIEARSGVKRSSFEPLSREKVLIHPVDEAQNPYGTDQKMGGATFIGHEEIHMYWKTISEDTLMNLSLNALHVLIHESVHTRAGVALLDSPEGKLAFKGGYREASFDLDGEGKAERLEELLGAGFDEAVTENIALEVMKEYLTRTGDLKQLVSTSPENNFNHVSTAYVLDRTLLNLITFDIAHHSKADRDTVWRAVVKGYFSDPTASDGVLNFRQFFRTISENMVDSGAYNMLLALANSSPLPTDSDFADKVREAAEPEIERALRALDPELIENRLGLR